MVKHSRRIHTFEASNWTQRYGGMTKYANKFPNLPIFWICEGKSPANSSTMPVHPCMYIRVHAKKEKMKERGEIGDLSKDFLRVGKRQSRASPGFSGIPSCCQSPPYQPSEGFSSLSLLCLFSASSLSFLCHISVCSSDMR